MKMVISAIACLGGMTLMGQSSADTETLNGSYIWNQRPSEPGQLTAVFTPQSQDQWQVEFHFVFEGNSLTYKGHADGSLKNGALKGQVTNQGENRIFVFQGQMRDGHFSGTHGERKRNGREYRTGTLTFGQQ